MLTNPLKVMKKDKTRVEFDNNLSFNINEGTIQINNENYSGTKKKQSTHQIYRENVPQLQLSMTDACNMSCSYCSFRTRIGAEGKAVNMPLHVAEKAINFYKEEIIGDSKYGRIDFGLAGEPFLRKNVHGALHEMIQETMNDMNVESIWAGPNVTNATLALDEKMGYEMGAPQDISIDGPKEIHDDLRTYSNGKGTYDDIVKVISMANVTESGVGASSVLTAKHTDLSYIFNHLYEELGFRSIYMKPVNLSPEVDYGLNSATLESFMNGYTNFINYIINQPKDKILNYLLALNKEDFMMRFFYRIKDNIKVTYRCGAGKSGAYVDTNGKLYPCAHFIGKKGWDIGDIFNGFNEEKRAPYLNSHVDSKEKCKDCWARYLCGGGCHYQAVLANNDINKPDDVKCELILHLCKEAIRLYTNLYMHHPEVLSALPDPIFINKEYINSEYNTKYVPVSFLEKSDQNIKMILSENGNIKNAIWNSEDKVTLEVKQSNKKLCLKFECAKAEEIEEISLWFVKSGELELSDISLLDKNIKGYHIKCDNTGVYRVQGNNDMVKKIPYVKPVLTSLDFINYSVEGKIVKIEIPISNIFTVDSIYGFNTTMKFKNSAEISLVRYEPYTLIDINVEGNLNLFNGEMKETRYEKSNGINEVLLHNMIAIHDWALIKPNVC